MYMFIMFIPNFVRNPNFDMHFFLTFYSNTTNENLFLKGFLMFILGFVFQFCEVHGLAIILKST